MLWVFCMDSMSCMAPIACTACMLCMPCIKTVMYACLLCGRMSVCTNTSASSRLRCWASLPARGSSEFHYKHPPGLGNLAMCEASISWTRGGQRATTVGRSYWFVRMTAVIKRYTNRYKSVMFDMFDAVDISNTLEVLVTLLNLQVDIVDL